MFKGFVSGYVVLQALSAFVIVSFAKSKTKRSGQGSQIKSFEALNPWS